MKWKGLVVERLAEQIALEVYNSTETFPTREHYGLARELRRSAVSIGSNIAEGRGRRSDVEFARYLDIALGSARELGFQWRLAKSLGYVDEHGHSTVEELVVRLSVAIRNLAAHYRQE